MANQKKAIKGFSALRYWPITANTSSAYTVGPKTDIPGAQSANITRNGSDYSIPADDGIYDAGTEFENDTLEITVAELGLTLYAALDGADYDTESGVYTWGPGSAAPEIALGFRAMMLSGGYRLVQYYRGKVTRITTNFNTKGSGGEISAYTITVLCSTRLADNNLLRMKDIAKGDAQTWLDTIDIIPVGGEG